MSKMSESTNKVSGMSRLRPPKIIAIKKRTSIPTPPAPVKKSCLKPAPILLASNSSGSSTSSSSSTSPGGTNVNPPIPGLNTRPSKSVQIRTSHNLVKLVRPNSGGQGPNHKARDSTLTSTFRELFRDFPANATGSVSMLSGGAGSSMERTTAARVNPGKPPPYRNPPPPVNKVGSLKRPGVIKRPQVDTFDEIEVDRTSAPVRKNNPPGQMGKEKDRTKDLRNSFEETLPRKAPPNNYVIFKTISEIRTKAEVSATQDGVPVSRGGEMSERAQYASDRFQNIPVKPRKSGGPMQRLENYCLFDPSVDFIREKDDPQRGVYGNVSGRSVSLCSDPEMRNYESIGPGPSNLIAETDLYILDSLTDAMYGQSIGLSGLEKGTSTPQLPGTPQSSRSSGISTPVGVTSPPGTSQLVVGSNDRYIQIYTDWANYYLERAKSKRKVTDLSTDCKDGLLLAEIIEAVTTFKVPDLVKKPKNAQQMHENVKHCLQTLQSHEVSLEKITASDISNGRLKAVLSLFFALSRYKQETKQKIANQRNQQQQERNSSMPPMHMTAQPPSQNRQIAVPYGKVHSNGASSNNGVGTAIPLPARRCPPDRDKMRPLPPTPNLPQTGNGPIKSLQSPEVSNNALPYKDVSRSPSVLKQPTNANFAYNDLHSTSTTGPHGVAVPTDHSISSGQKQSMLEKFKLFNREKTKQQQQISKRTSSSSGFSSAKSERSDSSLSLNEHQQQQPPQPHTSTSSSNGFGSQANRNSTGASTGLMRKSESHSLRLSSKVKCPSQSPSTSNLSRLSTGSDKGTLKLPSKSKVASNSNGKLSGKEVPKPKQIPGSLKLEPRPISGSKTNSLPRGAGSRSLSNGQSSLPSPAGLAKSSVTINSSTGIPKPMAAIKGTSKISMNGTEDCRGLNTGKPQQGFNHSGYYVQNIPGTSTGGHSMEKETTKAQIMNSMEVEIQDDSANYNNIISAVMAKSSGGVGMTDSTNSSSTSTTGLFSNSSESSVIFRPGSESAASEALRNAGPTTSPLRNVIPNRKMDQFSQNKFNTAPMFSSGKAMTPAAMNGHSMLMDQGMMPHRMEDFSNKNNVTLPTRGPRGQRQFTLAQPSYGVDLNLGKNCGYLSDGDAFRRTTGTKPYLTAYVDIENGYLSDGCSPNKHMMNVIRRRQILPTTFEERSKSNRFLDEADIARKGVMEYNSAALSGPPLPPPPLGSRHPHHGHGQPHPHAQQQHAQQSVQLNDNTNEQQQQQLSPPGLVVRKDKGGTSPSHHSRRAHSQPNASLSSHGKNGNTPNGSGSGGGGSSSGRSKGVPQSFGYIKRQANGNGSMASNIVTMDAQQHLMLNPQPQPQQQQHHQQPPQGGNRMAHVSAVPRGSKIKMSPSANPTQDLHSIAAGAQSAQNRSFSLTGPGATQLSQSIRERLATSGSHSLPKPGTDLNAFQYRMANRMSGKILDGSLSDTQTYAEVKQHDYGPYAMWLKHSNTTASRLSEGDSLENVQMGSPAVGRSHKAMVGRELHYSPNNSRLNRSNSIRSTKSEKLYPSVLSRGADIDIEPYYCLPVGSVMGNGATNLSSKHGGSVGAAASVTWSQPTSPTPVNRMNGPLSPTGGNGHKLVYASLVPAKGNQNDDVHGSSASLLSGASALYANTQEDRQSYEVRRLKKELIDAREQVLSLSSQLSTNAHVVSAFEQSLSNMTQRFHHLSATAERKDDELTDLRQTIELLRKQSIQAGLTSAHMQSMGVQSNNAMGLAGTAPHTGHMSKTSNCNTSPMHNASAAHGYTTGTPIRGLPQSSSSTGGEIAMAAGRHLSSDSMCSLNSISSGCSAQEKKKKKGWLRSSFTKAFSRNAKIAKTSRHVTGLGNSTENCHAAGTSSDIGLPPSGLNVSPSHMKMQNQEKLQHPQNMEMLGLGKPPLPAPPLPMKPPGTLPSGQSQMTIVEHAKAAESGTSDAETSHNLVDDLKKQLREKDLVLTDIRLEALSSASQLESLKDTVMKMRAEMMNLKQNNDRLQKLVTSRSLAGSEISLSGGNGNNGGSALHTMPTSPSSEPRRYSFADNGPRPLMELPKTFEEADEENIPPAPAPPEPADSSPLNSPTTHADLTPPPIGKVSDAELEHQLKASDLITTRPEDLDPSEGKKISIAVYLGQPDSFEKFADEVNEYDFYYDGTDSATGEAEGSASVNVSEFIVAYTYISGKTTWQNLDYIVRKTFKDYLSKIDPGTSLGLNTDSITSYHLGEAKRGPEMGFPELLPCGYIIGNVKTLYICLQGVGSLAFDSLIPRSIVHRYISLLTEHRRLILCGPSGTGKSYLARKLAEFLVARSGRGNPTEAIATFNVDHKSNKELQQYLGHVAEQAAMTNGVSELPAVIILDNLHHASALGDVFSCLLSAGPAAQLPCIIGTMSQATCNTTNLQLHHNFRWVLTANHMEPVKGFLSRYLRRKLFQLELGTMQQQQQLSSVLNWLPNVWQHINRFLETHSSSDVTIGPRVFLSCPLDLSESQVWFTEIWNFHLAPYLVDAVKEGVQLYGRRGGVWVDPSAFIRDSYPWSVEPTNVPSLRQINAEDVGLESGAANNSDNQDPLLNMLMRLQEAANYSNNNQDQESDCASLDSNMTQDSFAGSDRE